MTNPVPPMPEVAVRLWKWLNVCPDETYVEWSESEVDASLGQVYQIEGVWLPLASFAALSATAARADVVEVGDGLLMGKHSVEAVIAERDEWKARAEKAEADLDKVRAYAIESAEVCREAEDKRKSELSKRENGTIADMLREQVYSWGEKAKSYDALVVFIDALIDAAGGMGGG